MVLLGFDTARVDDRAAGPLLVHRYRGVCIRLYPGSLVSGEGADAAPVGSSRCAWGSRASIEVVFHSFGSPRWWRRRALLYGAGGTDLPADATGHTSIPLCWGGLLGGPEHGTASWGGF